MNKETLKEFDEIFTELFESRMPPELFKHVKFYFEVFIQETTGRKDKFYQEKFEKCLPEKVTEEQQGIYDWNYAMGRNHCRKEIIDNWNNDKKPTEN